MATAGAEPDSLRPHPLVESGPHGLLRSDRLRHASFSFTLAAGAGIATGSRGRAFAITFALGAAKELDDARTTRFDAIDLAADVIGALLGASAAARR